MAENVSITYKTIITKAVKGYNDIQNVLVDRFAPIAGVRESSIFQDIEKVKNEGGIVKNAVTVQRMITEINNIPVYNTQKLLQTPTVTREIKKTEDGSKFLSVSTNFGDITEGYHTKHRDEKTYTLTLATTKDVIDIANRTTF